MELRQLRFFVHAGAPGSMGCAAADLDVDSSALGQRIGRLEGELSTRLRQRTSAGVSTTDAN